MAVHALSTLMSAASSPARGSTVDDHAALTRRAALSGAVASVAMASVAAARAATGTVPTVSPALANLLEQYRTTYAAYDRICDDVSEPAQVRLNKALIAARASVPHIEMTHDMTGLPFLSEETKTYTTARRMDVVCAEVTAETKRDPADGYSEAQHRLFAFKSEFHQARLGRDRRVAAAEADARRLHDNSAEIAQENAAWDVMAAFRHDVVEFQPRSLADLAAKLSFYAESRAIDGQEDLLEQITRDVAGLASEGRH